MNALGNMGRIVVRLREGIYQAPPRWSVELWSNGHLVATDTYTKRRPAKEEANRLAEKYQGTVILAGGLTRARMQSHPALAAERRPKARRAAR